MRNWPVLVSAMIITSSAWANSGAWLTGDELLSACSDKENDYKQGLCVGYVLGAADGTTIWQLWKDLSSNICVPNRVEVGEMVDSVIAHLEDNPRELHFDASSVVLNALITTYPCR